MPLPSLTVYVSYYFTCFYYKMITRVKETYLVKDWNYSRTFEIWENWISIPWQYNNPNLIFINSKKKCVKSFYKALGEFIYIIEKDGDTDTDNPSQTTIDWVK